MQIHPSSFRDPSGFLYKLDNDLFRCVNRSYKSNYDLLISSGLYKILTDKKLLINHSEISSPPAKKENTYKILKPEIVNFISYPYEWSFSQLKDAAKHTLEVQKLALSKGMILKDASAYNIQFHHGKPIFIDTLSFEAYDSSKPWVAYRQFCQHFLAPLALMSHSHISLNRLLSLYIDGIPLDLTSKLLPWKTKLDLNLAVHIHLHAKSQAKHAESRKRIQSGFNHKKMNLLVEGLIITINKLKWEPGKTEWANYYSETHNYDGTALDEKAEIIKKLLIKSQPRTVWDLGANTGKFSKIASELGAQTIAFDIDPSCIEWNYKNVKKDQIQNILPLYQDLSNPSCSIGWANNERDSTIERGPADLVMSLGLIHHIIISNNIPMDHFSNYLASICNSLIIEFIPKEDSQVQTLLTTREDIFVDYNLETFIRIFERHFMRIDTVEIPNTKRTIFYFQKLQND